jgi:hypothetical protein
MEVFFLSDNGEDISKHIMPTASYLLGICFIILNFVNIGTIRRNAVLVLDKLFGISMDFSLAACILSYSSMRFRKRSYVFERVADLIFLSGLIFLTTIAGISGLEIT